MSVLTKSSAAWLGAPLPNMLIGTQSGRVTVTWLTRQTIWPARVAHRVERRAGSRRDCRRRRRAADRSARSLVDLDVAVVERDFVVPVVVEVALDAADDAVGVAGDRSPAAAEIDVEPFDRERAGRRVGAIADRLQTARAAPGSGTALLQRMLNGVARAEDRAAIGEKKLGWPSCCALMWTYLASTNGLNAGDTSKWASMLRGLALEARRDLAGVAQRRARNR